MSRRLFEQTIFSMGAVTETYDGLFQFLERHSPTEYDKIMDRVYAETHIGGGQHRAFDGSHTFAGSYESIADATGDMVASEYLKAHLNELVTPEGIPLLTLDRSALRWLTDEVSDALGDHVTPGQLRSFAVDLNSVNAGEVLSATVGVGFILLALRSSDPRALSRVVSLNLCVGLATANPLQIFAGLVGLGHGVGTGGIHAWGLLEGALPAAAGLAAFGLAADLLEVGRSGSLIAAILASAGSATVLAKLQATSRDRVEEELGHNPNYHAVLSPPVLSKEIEIAQRRDGNLEIEF
jgi:hypothetical protein